VLRWRFGPNGVHRRLDDVPRDEHDERADIDPLTGDHEADLDHPRAATGHDHDRGRAAVP
jgi:hypothetical protein